MKTCPNCNKPVEGIDAVNCGSCGSSLDSQPNAVDDSNDADLDFVVTETADSEPEFVGGTKKFSSDGDSLEVESPKASSSYDMTLSTGSDLPAGLTDDDENIKPIGDCNPQLPDMQQSPGDDWLSQPSQDPQNSATGKVRKLSEAEVKSIAKNLYSSSEYLAEDEKDELVRKMEEFSPKVDPPKPPSSPTPEKITTRSLTDLPTPGMADRNKGVAFFYKNYIQLAGNYELQNGDDITVHGREYVLHPKKFNTGLIIGIAATTFALILLFIGSMIVGDGGTGQGTVVGIVIDDHGRPYLSGATIRFPETGRSVRSNSQGFFKMEELPPGPQKVEYLFDGVVVKVDFVTVLENQTSTLSLIPDESEKSSNKRIARLAKKPVQRAAVEEKQEVEKEPVAKKPVQKKKRPPVDKRPGKIILTSNVDDARFELDGRVLGSGNLTYSRLSPGSHNYLVSRLGYRTVSGKVRVRSGKSTSLDVELLPLSNKEKRASYSANDFYETGLMWYEKRDYTQAVADLTASIVIDPGIAGAWQYRAESNRQLRAPAETIHDDYIRAAEIYRLKKNSSRAFSCYRKALEVDEKSITALLGRGNLYLDRGEEIAAIADFQTVLKINKKTFAAQYGIGEARFSQGNYKKAIHHFKKAKSLDSKNPFVYQFLMLSYLGREEIRNVRKTYKKFKNVASEEQQERFLADKKYGAIIRVLDKN